MSECRALCSRVVSALKEARMFAEAAAVLRDYLDEVKGRCSQFPEVNTFIAIG